ncbi:unnamed protein product [Mesocestoides corti]|uniref:Uncharacterized protein n=1 Tax=Mesocestoides corti TaxID=53468 RepID=A0A158QT33_MESCO|nr:unnamed protein product [Mesocestoides corti]
MQDFGFRANWKLKYGIQLSRSSFSNCPVVLQGNTQISHHPASPFAPITRVTSCGGRTSPPAASSRSNSDVAAPVCPQVHRSASPPSDYQRVFGSATGKGLLSHQAPSTPTGGGNEEGRALYVSPYFFCDLSVGLLTT